MHMAVDQYRLCLALACYSLHLSDNTHMCCATCYMLHACNCTSLMNYIKMAVELIASALYHIMPTHFCRT